MGKWQCPKCCQKNDPLKSIKLDSISKRARTKIITTNSKTGVRSSGTDKVSRLFGGSILSKRRSSSKGKSVLTFGVQSFEQEQDSLLDVSCRSKLSDPSRGGSIEGTSSCANVDGEKNPYMSPPESLADKKSIYPAEKLLSHSKFTNETSGGKHDVPSKNEFPRTKIVLAIGAVTDKDRKRKHEGNPGDSVKKHRTDKGKRSSKKRGSKATSASVGTSKLPQKRKTVSNGVFASLSKDDVGTKSLDMRGKYEVTFFCF